MSRALLFVAAVAVAVGAINPPVWPAGFEARVTMVEDGRVAEATWFWDESNERDRFDFADHEAIYIQINDYKAGVTSNIVYPRGEAPKCTSYKSGNLPLFNFSQFTFVGKKIWYHRQVDVWQFNESGVHFEYLDDNKENRPYQLSVRDANHTYEGIFFNEYRGVVPHARLFDLAAIFNGTCQPSTTPRGYVHVPIPSTEAPAVWLNYDVKVNDTLQSTPAWADANWNCGDVACSYRVAAGAAQPNYECAEFVARSLASSGQIGGISATAPQSAYSSYHAGGRTWDLCWVSSKNGGPLGLSDLLQASNWYQGAAGCYPSWVIVVLNWGHVIIGVGDGIVDAHNNARYHMNYLDYGTISSKYSQP